MDLSPDDMRGWTDVQLSARLNAEPADAPTPLGWPVLVLSHGLGVARAQYSALSQELASHGYVVLTVDHPMGGFTFNPQGTVLTPGVDSVPLSYDDHHLISAVRDWAIDAAFVVRRVRLQLLNASLPGIRLNLDTTSVGFLGHSLGGAAALQGCRSESIFKACVDMDGYPFGDVESEGVGKPFLVLLSEPDHGRRPLPKDSAEAAAREEFARMGRERDSVWAAISAGNHKEPWFVVKIRGTGHMSFCDAPFQMPTLLRDVGATLSPERTHRLIAERLLAFFDHFLRGQKLRILRPGGTTAP